MCVILNPSVLVSSHWVVLKELQSDPTCPDPGLCLCLDIVAMVWGFFCAILVSLTDKQDLWTNMWTGGTHDTSVSIPNQLLLILIMWSNPNSQPRPWCLVRLGQMEKLFLPLGLRATWMGPCTRRSSQWKCLDATYGRGTSGRTTGQLSHQNNTAQKHLKEKLGSGRF